ncbi:MAG: thiolase family protein [Candidatus Thermoplasmatota archaeon]|nr:thiolase family protein [Candidatus Thermoplasmatota archaeon]|tara:strand:+ start:254 stop:1396 length:1143 start_codon:yes stop_codon:yes gene_type:complete
MRAVICDYVRTPFHRAHKGELAQVRPEDMLNAIVTEILNRSKVNVNDIEDLMLGCAYPEGVQGLNLGRIATYLPGLPNTIPGMTTNRLCGSSMQVAHSAAGAISIGSGDVFLTAGVETMSLVKRGGWNRDLHPGIEAEYPDAYISMGLTAENLANDYSISRLEQEEFALGSHKKALSAQSKGLLTNEIVPVNSPDKMVEIDGCMRESTLEKMAKLKPAFIETGSVTAATSSPLTDGAACNLICSQNYVEEHSMRGMAEIVSTAVVGVPPHIMGIGPVESSKKALARAGITLDDVEIIELNEAFSAQSLAVMKDLDLNYDDNRVNIDGGALAIGHPLGASGARILGKAASLLNRTGGEYALASMCIGGGMGIATILRNCQS